MLYLYGLYNVDMISIYVIKVLSETSSPLRVATQEMCFLNLNEKNTGHGQMILIWPLAMTPPMGETTNTTLLTSNQPLI